MPRPARNHLPQQPTDAPLTGEADTGPTPPAPAPTPTLTNPPGVLPPPHRPNPSSPVIPGYLVGEAIARGGMGVVYEAFDCGLDRVVAIKTILPGARDTPAARSRFVIEAKTAARLPHPGIPPVHALGRLADGRPFLAMKLIRGKTLGEMIAHRPTPAADLPNLVRAFEQVCQAVGFAHSLGIVHRDLKPSNVMVGAFGEVQVMDWGLAKSLGRPDGTNAAVVTDFDQPAGADYETQAGQVLGTPAYMPPEQARGELGRVDRRADVFALGAILCEILTGAPPYAADSMPARLAMAAAGLQADCNGRLGRCGADPVLVEIARRCLHPNRDRRPADAGEVARLVGGYQVRTRNRTQAATVGRSSAEAVAALRRLVATYLILLTTLLAGLAAVAVLRALGPKP